MNDICLDIHIKDIELTDLIYQHARLDKKLQILGAKFEIVELEKVFEVEGSKKRTSHVKVTLVESET